MSPIEAKKFGFEDRHEHIGAGGMVVNLPAYLKTDKIYVALSAESNTRKNRIKVDKREESQPNAPKLQGQLGPFWETHNPEKDEDLEATLVRAVGQGNKPGEEVRGVTYFHSPTQLHLNTIYFAPEDGRIKPGTEDTALANYVILHHAPLSTQLQRGTHFDKDIKVRWIDLDQLLNPAVVFRRTMVALNNPDHIPDSPFFPVDPRVKREASNFVKGLIGKQRKLKYEFGKDSFLTKLFDEGDYINLGCIALRPGVLQTLEDLKDFFADPQKYNPKERIHSTLKYCEQFSLYEELAD